MKTEFHRLYGLAAGLTAASALTAFAAFMPEAQKASMRAEGLTALPKPAAATPVCPLPDSYLSFFPSRDKTAPSLPLGRPRRVAARSVAEDVYGFLYYYQGDNLSQGFYRLRDNDSPQFLWSDYYTANWSMPMTGGWIRDGKLCGVDQLRYMGGIMVYAQVEIDMASGEVLDFHQLATDTDMENVYLSMAYRDLDDRVYGFGYVNEGKAYGFKSADATDIDSTKSICEVDFANYCMALCYNRQDDLFYGVTTSGAFVSITPDGRQEALMKLDIPNLASTITGLVYSPEDGGYIYNAYYEDGTSALYLINPAARTSTLLYDFDSGQEFIYFVSPAPHALPDAPKAPEVSAPLFENGSLSGTLNATMPTLSLTGDALEGELKWRLLVDGGQLAAGTATAGSEVTIAVPDLSNGQHVFAVEAGDGDLWSDPAITRAWIGSDYPLPPADVTLTQDKVSWTAPSGSVHGGYVDFSALRYTVYLNGKRVASTTDLEAEIELPQGKPFATYTVEVKAVYDGHTSESGVSNVITYGDPLTIPEGKSLHFRPEENQWPLFKAFDLDGKTDDYGNTRNWHFSETMGFPSFASGADGEDLLIFPPIHFSSTEKTYAFEMEAGLISDIDTSGTIEVLVGKEDTPEAMTRTVIPATQLKHMRGVILTGFFSVAEPGTYYIGVLTHTGATAFHISDMDIRMTERDADVPMTVDGLTAVGAPDGSLFADVSFTMPTLNVFGSELPADALLTATVTSRDYVLDHPYEGETIATTTVTGRPGEKVEARVATQQNYNTIGVSCSLNGRQGVETTTMVFTGVVKPYTVNDLKITATEDNMGVHLSWNPPTQGQEEGPIGDSFFYSLWYYGDGWQFLDGVGYDVCEAEVMLDPENPQTILMMGVMAMNAAGQSDHIASGSIVAGIPYVLPMEETLPDGEPIYWPVAIQRPTSDYGMTSWMVTDPSDLSPIFANESGWAYIGYVSSPDLTNQRSRLSLPKFSTEGCEDVKFTLTYWGGPYEAPFTLMSDVYGEETPAVIEIFPTGKGWMNHTVTLPTSLEGLKWVELLLDTYMATDQNFALFSGYSVSVGSGVPSVEGMSGERIWTSGGMLHISGHAGETLVVSDLSGRVVLKVDSLGDLAGYALAPGTYAVSVGSTSRLVIVR